MLDPRETQFWLAAIRSGLMDVEGLTACWEAIEPAKRDDPETAERRLARHAVRSSRLTHWQANNCWRAAPRATWLTAFGSST